MIKDQDLPELKCYHSLERRLPFEVDHTFAPYVAPASNEDKPIHRWFRYKESFSADLLYKVIQELIPNIGYRFRLLDPFCGVGTTLVNAQELHAKGYEIVAIGIERNPFAAFVSNTKINWRLIHKHRLMRAAEVVLASDSRASALPKLSSLSSGRCMSRYMGRKIVHVRNSILGIHDKSTRDALLLGLAASIEPVSRVRKDGRALRLVDKPALALAPELLRHWSQIATDATLLRKLVPSASVPTVIVGDGRRPTSLGLHEEPFDLIVTSPPYPNNIDYSEVYKLELWLLGFITDKHEFLRLRKSTFRSHPSASVPTPCKNFLRSLRLGKLNRVLQPLLKRVRASGDNFRERLLLGYFSDLWLSLEDHHRCLRKGGYEVLIVGNSLHGRSGEAYLIPTDIVVAAIAEELGFSVAQIVAARGFKRRLQGNHFLRESIVVLQK